MSRHEVPSESPAYKLFVGWDPPLLTYFGQVYRTGHEEEGPVFWYGTSPAELCEIEDLAAAMRPWVLLSAELRMLLFADKDLDR